MPTSFPEDAFTASRARFEAVCCFMGGAEATSFTHAELEQRLTVDARDLVRQLLQDHLDLRATREQRSTEPSRTTTPVRSSASSVRSQSPASPIAAGVSTTSIRAMRT
jgi:hypothetical protein